MLVVSHTENVKESVSKQDFVSPVSVFLPNTLILCFRLTLSLPLKTGCDCEMRGCGGCEFGERIGLWCVAVVFVVYVLTSGLVVSVLRFRPSSSRHKVSLSPSHNRFFPYSLCCALLFSLLRLR